MAEYSVMFEGNHIGTATVEKQGLYYRIYCTCCAVRGVPIRIIASADRECDLGLCIPVGDHICLKKSIPVKYIGEGELKFRAQKKRCLSETAVPMIPNLPFQHIAKLMDAYLIRHHNEVYIDFKNQYPILDQPDNDQTR